MLCWIFKLITSNKFAKETFNRLFLFQHQCVYVSILKLVNPLKVFIDSLLSVGKRVSCPEVFIHILFVTFDIKFDLKNCWETGKSSMEACSNVMLVTFVYLLLHSFLPINSD